MAISELTRFSEEPEFEPPRRRFPVGAEFVKMNAHSGIHFRVWAPAAQTVTLVLHRDQHVHYPMSREEAGYHSALVNVADSETRYSFAIDDGPLLLPDPASRYQPSGPQGPSQVIDPESFSWTDGDWPGLTATGQVIYEMHVGTFTPEGTWRAAAEHLAELATLGITAIELMPVGDFPGRFGWGYDVANLFAPTWLYGTPDEFRAFVNEAHRVGIGVLLDVVYNHLGAIGESLLRPFSPDYFSSTHETDWGAALNFDGAQAGPVRDFILTNVRYWIREFHLDGLRVDATQAVHDDSSPHILLEICRSARAAAGSRSLWLLGENEPQHAELFRASDEGGFEFDALWNDDFHHAAMVRLTGHNEAYYTDYRGSAEEFVAAARWGFLFQSQRYHWQQKPRGTPALDIAPQRFVNFIQNHDQLANSARGERVHQLTSPGRYRAMTALLLLAPQTPLLFQGQEFAASSPFLYFNDCGPDQQDQVRRGRAEFLAQFPSLATDAMQRRLVDPCDPDAFLRSKLDHTERHHHEWAYALHRDLLRLRREDAVFAETDGFELAGGTLGENAFLLRFFTSSGETRLLLVNFDRDLHLTSVPNPLIAPPAGQRWSLLWSSEAPEYRGQGITEVETSAGWRIPGEAAVLLIPVSIGS